MFNRRQALGIIGSAFASPLLIGGERSLIANPGVEHIPTGFPVLDAAFDGGMRRGGLYACAGPCGSGKSLMTRSIAMNASDTHNVAYMPMHAEVRNMNRSQYQNFNDKNLFLFFAKEQQKEYFEQLRLIADSVDLIIADCFVEKSKMSADHLISSARQLANDIRILQRIAHDTDTAVLLQFQTNRSPVYDNVSRDIVSRDIIVGGTAANYYCSGIWNMAKNKDFRHSFTATIHKNRIGPRFSTQDMVFVERDWMLKDSRISNKA